MNRQAQLFFSFCYCLTSTITVQYNFCPRNKYNIFYPSVRYVICFVIFWNLAQLVVLVQF